MYDFSIWDAVQNEEFVDSQTPKLYKKLKVILTAERSKIIRCSINMCTIAEYEKRVTAF